MIDLHTHSSISDGDLSPQDLIKTAKMQGLRAVALTDHDTIAGLKPAKEAVAAMTDSENFHFIPGIEININWTSSNDVPGLGPGGEFHLLGLGIGKPSRGFIEAVEVLSRRREARNREILNKMNELNLIANVDAAWDDILADSGSHSLGRPHFANFLVKLKIVKDINQAFSRYLSVGKPLYVPKIGMNFDEAVVLIRESGGIPILAHPISLFVAWGRLPDLIKNLKERGLTGIEAWHPTAKPGSCRRLEVLARDLGLYVTEGSDFHGSIRPGRKLGYSSKERKIDDSVLAAIEELGPKLQCV